MLDEIWPAVGRTWATRLRIFGQAPEFVVRYEHEHTVAAGAGLSMAEYIRFEGEQIVEIEVFQGRSLSSPAVTVRPRPPESDGAPGFLDAALDAWERNNTVLLSLVGALPRGGLQARAAPGSPTVAEMLTHLHHERMVSVQENCPEFDVPVAAREWDPDVDAGQIAAMLRTSAALVRDAVRARALSGRALEQDFAHPVHLLHFLTFHDGYHHGQIKLALKAAGIPLSDQEIGPLTWAVWRERQAGP